MAKTAAKVGVWNRALSRIGYTEFVEADDEDAAAESAAAEACRLHYDDVVLRTLEANPWPFATKQAALSRPNGTASYTGDASTTEYSIPFVFRHSDDITVTVAGAANTAWSATGAGETGGSLTFDSAPADSATIVITAPLAMVGWDYCYALPSDCAFPMAILVEGQRIGLTNPDERIPFEIMEDFSGDWRVLCLDYDADEFAGLEYTRLHTGIAGWPRGFLEAVVWRLAAELALALPKDRARWRDCMQAFEMEVQKARDDSNNARHPDPEPDPPSVSARSGGSYYEQDWWKRR